MRIVIASLLSFLAATTGVDAHSYLTVPSPRFVGGVCRWSAPSDQFGQLFCRGPCETTQKNVGRTHQAQRGQRVQVAWSRNNHGGGFVRLAWAPTAQSDDPNVFNNNVQKYSCYEVGNGCLADNGQPSGGGDNDGTQNTQCNTAIEIPNWLPNGKYTLQWSWFGGLFDFSDYYSCADFEITGGPNAPAHFGRAQNNAKPVFEGGDVKYPGQQACELVNTDRLGVCVREPCRDPVNNPTRNPFAAQFPYNQRKRGIPFSSTELVMMPGRINTADSRGSSGSDGTVIPPGTPPVTNPGTVDPVSPPAPTGDSIQSYAGGAPATVGTTGGFNVGIQFSATAPSIIFADLLQTGTWAKFGWASSEVGTGQGQQNLRLNVGAGLTAGSNYIVNLWIVKRTEYVKDPNTAWQRAIVKPYPVTVVNGNAATYPTLANAIDGIPGSIPRAVPRLDAGQVFSVSFSYSASTTRELQVDLLSTDYTAYFGGGSVTVPGGRGRATIDVRVTASSGARTDIMLNLVSKVPGTEWNTPGSIVKGFPVKVENTLRLASAAGDQTVFTNTTLDWGDLPADSFDNDVQARCRPISANQSVCDPMNAATSTSIAGSVIALMMVTVGAFLAL